MDSCTTEVSLAPKNELLFFLAEIPEETVFLTKAHMYGHNSSSLNVNFKPDFNKHESTIYFEPISGTPIYAQLRIQLNTNAWIDRLQIHEDGSTEYDLILRIYKKNRFFVFLDRLVLVLFVVLFQ